jgi:hypothetical protein
VSLITRKARDTALPAKHPSPRARATKTVEPTRLVSKKTNPKPDPLVPPPQPLLIRKIATQISPITIKEHVEEPISPIAIKAPLKREFPQNPILLINTVEPEFLDTEKKNKEPAKAIGAVTRMTIVKVIVLVVISVNKKKLSL